MSAATETAREAHQANQRAAADPSLSAWVEANAGSGKTKMLVDRVARLLMDGARPGGILCLTFTKAAATEMALRLNDQLGRWATLPDDALQAELTALLGRPAASGTLIDARQLFARALDTPGGLRLQTVHAFCEALLKRFPVEAAVPPHFTVADDGRSRGLLLEARAEVLRAGERDPAFGGTLDFLAARLSDARLDDLLEALVARRRDLSRLFDATGGAAAAVAALRRRLHLAPDAIRDRAVADHVAGLDRTAMTAVADALARGGVQEKRVAAPLARWLEDGCPADRIESDLFPVFFKKDGEPYNRLATKTVLADSRIEAAMLFERDRLKRLKETLNGILLAEVTAAALHLAERLLAAYADLKRHRGLLDYDDLVLRTRDLVAEPGRVAWVMYKLDQGLDHILVDEAQDTSPDQWEVIQALADDFFAGAGAREGRRTVFAVGDKKQSIYSFQGARPQSFLAMREHFAREARAGGAAFKAVPLEMSFRSTPAVLSLVDAVFAAESAKPGVVEPGAALAHLPMRAGLPGRIELWPPFAPERADDGEPWSAPVDYVGRLDPRVQLAEAIARQVKDWIGREFLPSLGRMLRPEDVMILVRRRNGFFDAMVRALKMADVPVAGADRMKLAEQMATQDLVALGRFCLLPQDDLTLATVLKGPLFDLTDEDLQDLCWSRPPGSLWRQFKARAAEKPHWATALAELRRLLAKADFAPPFDFYAELLGAGGGRQRLLTRLGSEANEPIDEFLAAAQRFERESAPSLQGFLAWFAAEAVEVKRDMDQKRSEVRVLTVHAAKGLEAPVVILPDTCDLPQSRDKAGLLWSETDAAGSGALLLWPPRKEFEVGLTSTAKTAAEAARMAEYRRLLYVALTRAADRLYIAGYLNRITAKSGPPAGCWYDLIQAGFAALEPKTRHALPWGGEGVRYENRGEPLTNPEAEAAAKPIGAVPDWCRRPPPPEPDPPLPLAPSRPSRTEPPPASPISPSQGAGLQRGRLIHRLLQTLPDLPVPEREAAARRFLAHPGHRLAAPQQEMLLTEVMRLLADPDFTEIFAPDAVTEAPIAGRLGNRIVSGRIDRLLVRPDQILLIDYKTDRPPPANAADVDTAYRAQMGLYAALLEQIFPGRRIKAGLIWTYAPKLMLLPSDLLTSFTGS